MIEKHSHLTRGRTREAGEIELTPRQRELLQCLIAGMTNKEIGEQMELTEGTVKAYLTALYYRVGVHGRLKLATWARGGL